LGEPRNQKPETMKTTTIISVAHEMPAGEPQPDEIPVPYGTRKTLAMGPEVGEIEETFDRSGAEAIAAHIAARKGKKGFKGYPVYQGHPDAPAPIGSKYPNKAAVGWITAVDPGDTEAVFHVRWLANPGEGFSHFSPYWGGTFDASKKLLVVTVLKSLGLTNDPDYDDMALPHEGEGSDQPAGTPAQPKKETRMDPKAIAKLLGLPETATEEEINAAIGAALKAKADAEAQAKKAGEEKQAAETALEHERKARRGAILDRAVEDGRITAAERDVWDARLAHEKSFDAECKALEALPAKLKTAPSAKAAGARAAAAGRDQVLALAHEKMAADKSLDFSAAYQAVKAERPDLWVAGGKAGEA